MANANFVARQALTTLLTVLALGSMHASAFGQEVKPASVQAPPGLSQSPSSPSRSDKRLSRSVQSLGPVDDHACNLDRKYRREDYLARIDQATLSKYVAAAEAGDREAMYLLAQVPRDAGGGDRTYPYRDRWLAAAARLGHPLAELQVGATDFRSKRISGEQYQLLIEKAAIWEADGDVAWRLAYSYLHPDAEKGDIAYPVPRPYPVVQGDKAKGLRWARVAAEKGNVMAAEDLCTRMTLNTAKEIYGLEERDPAETLKWCRFASQAACSSGSATMMSILYDRGDGIARSPIDALVWRSIAQERRQRNLAPLGKWEYMGAPE